MAVADTIDTIELKKDAKRQALTSEGERLFERYGYRKVTVDEIVAAAGVAKGTFYLYFKTKDALYRDIFDSYHDTVIAGAFEMVKREGDLKRALFVDMVGGLYYLQKRPILMEIMVGNTAYFSETVTQKMVHAHYIEMASETFKGLESRLAPDLTMDDFINLYGIYLGMLRNGDPADPADPAFWRLVGNTARVLINGMLSRTSWNPRPVEEIIKEVDSLFTQAGDR